MVQKFFLALDYKTADEVVDRGLAATEFLRRELGNFSEDFVKENLGVKLNLDAFIGAIDPRYKQFRNIFADLKISHGADTGNRIMKKISDELHISYVTVPASFGPDILREYVKAGKEYGISIVAFTVHTKIAPEHIKRMYNRSLADEVYVLGQIASEAGCDAMVCEGAMLKDEQIRNLPIKKLVTGIRIDTSAAGSQKRVTALDELVELKQHVDYVVISSRIIDPDIFYLKKAIQVLR